MAEWQSPKHLSDHFEKHGRAVGARTVEEYDASARAILARDDAIVVSYEDRSTGLRRVGVYDESDALITVLSDDDRWIVNHFRARRSYLRRLLRSTYE